MLAPAAPRTRKPGQSAHVESSQADFSPISGVWTAWEKSTKCSPSPGLVKRVFGHSSGSTKFDCPQSQTVLIVPDVKVAQLTEIMAPRILDVFVKPED